MRKALSADRAAQRRSLRRRRPLQRAAEPLGMVIDVQGRHPQRRRQDDAARRCCRVPERRQSEIQLSQPARSMTVDLVRGLEGAEVRRPGAAEGASASRHRRSCRAGAAQERAVSDEKVEATAKLPPRLGQAAISYARPEADDARAGDACARSCARRRTRRFGDWVVYAMGAGADRPDRRGEGRVEEARRSAATTRS